MDMDTVMYNVYWGMAVVFSLLFCWQMLGMVFGHFSGGESVDAAGAHDAAGAGHHGGDHGADPTASFRLLSIRSVAAFGLLFGWSGILYTMADPSRPNTTLLYSFLWGTSGMVLVSLLLYFMLRLSETGTQRIATCVGERGTVYMDIPAGGTGKVRVMMSSVVSMVDARIASGEALKAGTPVIVKRCLDASTVEVEKAAE
jgi:membrane protein implicated in regulation of membrane protease activity